MTGSPATAPGAWSPPAPLPERFVTERLFLRPWVAEDAGAMFAALEVDRASFLPWLPWVGVDNRTVAECTYQIERFRRQAEERPLPELVLGVFDRATGEVVGGTGLHDIRPDSWQAETGYWIRADRRGCGLCTEAVGGLVSWCFAPPGDGGWDLRRIEIRCASRNVASARVPKKLGFTEEARLRRHRWIEGQGWDDTLIFAALREEWRR